VAACNYIEVRKPSLDLTTLKVESGVSNCFIEVISGKYDIVWGARENIVREIGYDFSAITYSQEPKKEGLSPSSAGQYRHDAGTKMCLSFLLTPVPP
jgi:hypothetical protein